MLSPKISLRLNDGTVVMKHEELMMLTTFKADWNPFEILLMMSHESLISPAKSIHALRSNSFED